MDKRPFKKTPNAPQQNNGKTKFNKKKFMNEKFNKKLKIQQWEEKRKKFAMMKYKKELRKNNLPFKSNTNPSDAAEHSGSRRVNQSAPRVNSIKAAQLELQRRNEEKQKAIEEKMRRRKEIDEAINKYKKKKAEKFRKLSTKTKTGQPVMRDRIQLLYEQLQQTMNNES